MMKYASVKGTLLWFCFLARITLTAHHSPAPGILLWLLLSQVSINKWLLTLTMEQNQELLNIRDTYAQMC